MSGQLAASPAAFFLWVECHQKALQIGASEQKELELRKNATQILRRGPTHFPGANTPRLTATARWRDVSGGRWREDSGDAAARPDAGESSKHVEGTEETTLL